MIKINHAVLIFLAFLCVKCNNASHKTGKDSSLSTNKDTVVKKQPGLSSRSDHIAQQSTMQPYKRIDSLVKLFEQQHKNTQLLKLDSICLKSDGDVTEYLDEISLKLFNLYLNDYTGYLLSYPHSCLKDKIIEAIGAEFSVYDKAERPLRLSREHDRVILKAKKEMLSSQKIQLIEHIFKKVNPDLLD